MTHHRRGLRRELKDDALADRIDGGWHTAGLDEKRRAMLTYAEKLTRDPGGMLPEDLEALRQVGFSDADILGIAEVVAYYAFANRIADGLGVTTDGERVPPT